MSTHERPATRVCKKCKKRKPVRAYYEKRPSRCKECELEGSRLRYQKNREKVLARCAEYRKNNKEKIQAYMKQRYQDTKEEWLANCRAWQQSPRGKEMDRKRHAKRYRENCDEIQAKRKQYYSDNPEAKAKLDEYQRRYAKENKAKVNSKTAKRRAARVQATQEWADKKAIAKFYERAEQLTRETGIKHVVDHIIPLQGRNVCGLHIETNLQVIPEKDNLKKFNKFSG